MTCACAAAARPALATCPQGWQATCLGASPVRATPRYGPRGRPGPGVQPKQLGYRIEGGLAASRAARPALIDQHRGCLLATHARDATPRPPPPLLDASTGQTHAERGVRCWPEPECLAAALDRNTPERSMALLMVMTVCVVGYAALEYRMRQARQAHDATLPHQHGNRGQPPTARWVLHDCVGLHLRIAPGPWPLGLKLTAAHRHLLQRLGKPSMAC